MLTITYGNMVFLCTIASPTTKPKPLGAFFPWLGRQLILSFWQEKRKKGRKGGKRKGKKRRKGEERVKIDNKSTEIDPNVADSSGGGSGSAGAGISTGHSR